MALTPLDPPEVRAKKWRAFLPASLRHASAARRGARSLERAMLGPEHPFVRARDDLRSSLRQVAALVGVLVVGIGARLSDVTWSWALLGAAGAVLVGLFVLLSAVRQRIRDEAIDLLLSGYETAPIAAVQNERRRLTSRRTRRALSKTYAAVAHQAQPPTVPVLASARPLFQRRVVRSVITEVLAVGRALEEDRVPAAAVARAERLITNGASSLYGADEQALKAELSRILDDFGTG